MAQAGETIGYFRPDVMAGRVVLVTGGGSGIGFEIARQFGLHGAKGVVLMGRRQKFLDEAVALLAADNVRAESVVGDIRKPQDCVAAVDRAVSAFGSLDVLINSAAGNFLAAPEQLSPNGFKTVVEIDLQGMFNMAHAAFPSLKASKFGGVVTSISATLHYSPTWYQAAPVAAKAAIDALTRNLALEWGEFGIRCNCVAPGPTADTPGMHKLSGGREFKPEDFRYVPLRRAGTKAEIASACIYLCLNTYITGEILAVCGGDWFAKTPPFKRDAVAKISRGVEGGSRLSGPSSGSSPEGRSKL